MAAQGHRAKPQLVGAMKGCRHEGLLLVHGAHLDVFLRNAFELRHVSFKDAAVLAGIVACAAFDTQLWINDVVSINNTDGIARTCVNAAVAGRAGIWINENIGASFLSGPKVR